MSSQTPNLNLVLPVGTEKVSRQIINDNNTKIDTAVGANSTAIAKIQNGLAYIVGNTNTTGGTLAVGQFVYVKGHSTIAEGLRIVTASISANGNITTSNTSACSGGGLNALNSNLSNVKTQVSIGGSLTSNYVTIHSCLAQYIGALAFYCLEFTPTTAIPAGTEFISGLKVPNGTRNDICVFEGVVVGSTTVNKFTVRDGGKLKNLEAISDTSRRRMTFMYFTV